MRHIWHLHNFLNVLLCHLSFFSAQVECGNLSLRHDGNIDHNVTAVQLRNVLSILDPLDCGNLPQHYHWYINDYCGLSSVVCASWVTSTCITTSTSTTRSRYGTCETSVLRCPVHGEMTLHINQHVNLFKESDLNVLAEPVAVGHLERQPLCRRTSTVLRTIRTVGTCLCTIT